MLLWNPLFPFKFFLNYSKNVGRSYKELSWFNRHDSIMSYSVSYKSTVLYNTKYRKKIFFILLWYQFFVDNECMFIERYKAKLSINRCRLNLRYKNDTIKYMITFQFEIFHWFLFRNGNGYSIKAYEMHCFCWKAPIGLQIVLLPISILSVLYRHILFSMNKYIAQYMYHK